MNKKKDEHHFVTTKNYVPIQIVLVHNQEVGVNWNTTCSFPKGIFPLGIETIWGHTFSIPFQLVFYLNLIFQTFYVEDHSYYLKNQIAFFPFSAQTTWLRFFYGYNPFAIAKHIFYNGKFKINNNGHPKHL